MEQWQKNLYIVLITVFIGQASFTLITPFLPLVLRSMGQETNLAMWSGMAYSASFLTSGLMAPVWGSISDKYGKRIQILRSGVGIAITYFFYPLAHTPLQFVILRGLTGFLSGFLPAATSLIATNTPEDKIGYSLGTLQAASAAGTISGPLFGGIIIRSLGFTSTFRTAACFLFVMSCLAFIFLKEEISVQTQPINILRDIRDAFTNLPLARILVCLFLVQAGIQMTQPTLTLYIDIISKGINAAFISGIIHSIAGIGTVLGSTLTASKKNKLSHFRLFLISLLGAAIFSSLQGIWLNLTPLSVSRFFFGAFAGALMVCGNVLAAQAVSRNFRGRAFGVLNGVLPLGSVVGPMIGGFAGDSFGIGSAFYVSGLVFLFAAGLLVASGRQIPTQAGHSKATQQMRS